MRLQSYLTLIVSVWQAVAILKKLACLELTFWGKDLIKFLVQQFLLFPVLIPWQQFVCFWSRKMMTTYEKAEFVDFTYNYKYFSDFHSILNCFISRFSATFEFLDKALVVNKLWKPLEYCNCTLKLF